MERTIQVSSSVLQSSMEQISIRVSYLLSPYFEHKHGNAILWDCQFTRNSHLCPKIVERSTSLLSTSVLASALDPCFTINASSERSFSTMKRLKTYPMGQSRLNHLMVLNIYKEMLDSMDITSIGSEFIQGSEHRCIINITIIIYLSCPQCHSQIAPETTSEGEFFNIFLGEHAPRPP